MFGLTSLFLFTLLVVLVMMLLFAGTIIVVVLFTAWLLSFLTALTFPQATLLAGVTAAMFIWYEQREFDLHPFNLVMLITLATPLVNLVLFAMAWVVARFSPLDLMHSMLLTAGIGLSALYNLMARVSSLPDYLLDDDMDDDKDDYDDDDDHYFYYNDENDDDDDDDDDDINDIVDWLYSKDPKKKK